MLPRGSPLATPENLEVCAALEQLTEGYANLTAQGRELEERLNRMDLHSTTSTLHAAELETPSAELQSSADDTGVVKDLFEELRERINVFQDMLNSTLNIQASATAAIDSVKEEIQGELARRDGFLAGLKERVEGMEQKLGEFNMDDVHKALLLGDSCSTVRLFHPEQDQRAAERMAASLRELLAAERAVRKAQDSGMEKFLSEKLQTIQELISVLEKELHESVDCRAAEVAKERSTREALGKELQNKLQENRDVVDLALADEKKERQLLAREVSRLEQDLREEENTRRSEMNELRALVRGEQAAREKQQSSLQEFLALERSAIEVHLNTLREHFSASPASCLRAQPDRAVQRMTSAQISGMMSMLQDRLDCLERSIDPLVFKLQNSMEAASETTCPPLPQDLLGSLEASPRGSAHGAAPPTHIGLRTPDPVATAHEVPSPSVDLPRYRKEAKEEMDSGSSVTTVHRRSSQPVSSPRAPPQVATRPSVNWSTTARNVTVLPPPTALVQAAEGSAYPVTLNHSPNRQVRSSSRSASPHTAPVQQHVVLGRSVPPMAMMMAPQSSLCIPVSARQAPCATPGVPLYY